MPPSNDSTDRPPSSAAWPSPRVHSRPEILAAAVHVVAERGAERARFTDVARAAKTSVGTLQYSFGSLHDLLIATFRHAVEADLAYLEEVASAELSPWDRLVGFVDAIMTDDAHFATARKVWIEFWRFAMREPELSPAAALVYGRWRTLFEDTINDGISQGMFRLRRPISAEITLIFAALDGITIPILLGLDPGVAEARDLFLEQLAWQLGYSEFPSSAAPSATRP